MSSSESKIAKISEHDSKTSGWSDIFLLKEQLTEEENMIQESAHSYAQNK